MDHSKFLTLARKYRGQQVEEDLKFWELLVKQEEDVLDWRHPKTPYHSWSELLVEEALCTPTMYRNYKKARSLLQMVWIRRLGAHASVGIAKLEATERDTIFTSVKKWYGQHQVPPTYQRVSTYVKKLQGTHRKTKRDTRIQDLRAYVTKCQALLKKNRIPIPQPSPI